MPVSGFDYRQASIEELLKEVDALDLPDFEAEMPKPLKKEVAKSIEPLVEKPEELLSKVTDINTNLFSEGCR